MAVTMVYLLPMLLGRTFDMATDTVGIDIFRQEDVDAADTSLDQGLVTSLYTVVEKSSDKRDFMNINGELSLKIKSGAVNVKGTGEYLKESTDTSTTVQVLVKLECYTITKSLDIDAKPVSFWKQLKKEAVGTHFVSSVTYGGSMFATVDFKVTKKKSFQSIKGDITAALGSSGKFNIEAQGKLEKVIKDLEGHASVEIKYYATVPLSAVPTDIKSLMNLVSTFKDEITKVNNGSGVPIKVILKDLKQFDPKFKFTKNTQLNSPLLSFDDKFEDLRTAKRKLSAWLANLSLNIKKQDQEQILDYNNRLTKTLDVFYSVIGKLDMEANTKQLQPALKAYKDNKKKTRGGYAEELLNLMASVVEEEEPETPRSVFTHWGAKTCPDSTALIYVGFMTSHANGMIGSAAKYQCLPENPQWQSEDLNVQENRDRTVIAGVKYKLFSVFKDKGKDIEGKLASCVVCEIPIHSTVQMIPLAKECPGSWKKQYRGFIVSGLASKLRTESVCVDYDPMSYDVEKDNKDERFIQPSVLKTDDPDNPKAVPCIVCSK